MNQPVPPAQPTPPTQPIPPNVLFEKFSAQLKAHIKKGFEIGVDAAKRADDDDFGIDARISVAHKFVDFEVKGHAELLETLIAGPWIAPCTPKGSEYSDTVTVDATIYPRNVSLDGAFYRVGWKSVKLDHSKLSVSPKVLPAGGTDITITLLDSNYTGANYRGRVTLQKVVTGAAAPEAPETPIVAVGL